MYEALVTTNKNRIAYNVYLGNINFYILVITCAFSEPKRKLKTFSLVSNIS